MHNNIKKISINKYTHRTNTYTQKLGQIFSIQHGQENKRSQNNYSAYSLFCNKKKILILTFYLFIYLFYISNIHIFMPIPFLRIYTSQLFIGIKKLKDDYNQIEDIP